MNRTDDECYTGTGPAGEVAERRCAPTYAELLAQRDELASKLEAARETLIEVSKFYGAAGQFARAALSRIKGA